MNIWSEKRWGKGKTEKIKWNKEKWGENAGLSSKARKRDNVTAWDMGLNAMHV